MTATRDELKPIKRPVPRSSRVEWPEASPRRESTLGSTLGLGAAFGAARVLTRTADLQVEIGVMVVVAAIFVLVLKGRRWRRVRALESALAAGAPTWEADWTADRATAAGTVLARPVPELVQYIGAALVGAMTTSAFTATSTTQRWVSVGIAVSLVTLLAAWVVFRGGAQVTFERFPYVLGTRATFFVATTSGSPRLEDASVMLRCVVPAHYLDGKLDSKRPSVTQWSCAVDLPPVRSPGPEEFVEVTFDIPADLPTTALHDDDPVRWELLVGGRTRWGRLVETVVVPVYAAPGAVPAGAS